MMFLLYVPVILGLIMVIFAKPFGIAFCRVGKANWRMLTFGMTDMGRFYNEQRAPLTMRLVGAAFLIFGIIFLYQLGFPFNGPGRFKATVEAKAYMSAKYGTPTGNWRISAKSGTPDNTVVIVDYLYDGQTGSLRAEWQDDRYKFSEIKKK